jgi:homoserine kinase type II
MWPASQHTMAVYTALETAEISQIAQDCGFARLIDSRGVAAGSVNTHYLLETARGKYFLKVDEVKKESDVKREIDLLLFLRRHGFPCPEPVQDRKGRHYREIGGKCVSVYRYIDGHGITTKHALTQIQNAGQALATLHGVGKAYKKGIENRFNYERVSDLYADVRARLPQYFKNVVRTLDDEADYLQHHLEAKLPKGIIHGDLFPDNLLFKGQKIVGVLDFDAAGRGKFIYDMATAVNALCYSNGSYDLKSFEAFVAGYEGLRTLSLAEWDAFPNELRFSAFRFTVTRLKDFFLNPVDDRQRVNKDFREPYNCLRVLRRERDGGMEGLLMAMATGYDYRKYQRVKALEKKGVH